MIMAAILRHLNVFLLMMLNYLHSVIKPREPSKQMIVMKNLDLQLLQLHLLLHRQDLQETLQMPQGALQDSLSELKMIEELFLD